MTQLITELANLNVVLSSDSNRSNRRADLKGMLTLGYIQGVLSHELSLGHITNTDITIIHTIVQRNVLSGRIARLIHRRNVLCVQSWLPEYVLGVAQHYTKEKTEWRLFRTSEGHMALYELLLRLSRGYVKQLRLWSYDVHVEDIANEAFCNSIDWLRNYPFDLDLKTWLDRHVRECALCVNQIAPAITVILPIEDVDNAIYYDDIQHHYHSQQIIYENWCSIKDRLPELSDQNFQVLRLWYHGYNIAETAQALDLTSQAVANRRHRLQKLFRSERLCHNKAKRENRSNSSARSLT